MLNNTEASETNKIDSSRTCTVCNIQIEEHYCTRCGQKVTNKKLSTDSILIDFISNFFSVNKSGFATIYKILINPKKIVENYIAGFSKYYASPGTLLVYGIAAITLHLLFIDNTVLSFNVKSESISSQYGFWLIFGPFLMVVSYLSFIRKKRDFADHMISITYISTSLFIAILLIIDFVYLISGKLYNYPAFFAFILLTFFWNSRVFSEKKSFFQFVLNTLLQVMLFSIIVGIIFLLNYV